MATRSRRVRAPHDWLNPAGWAPRTWLGIAVFAYVVLSFELSSLRFIQFGTSNFDFGIYSQSLWSQSHGYGLFNAGDYELVGATSFLRIHPAIAMFALAPIYGAASTPWTLFAIQSIAVGLAALPLYRLTTDLTRSQWKGLLASVLYLAWAPLLAATLFDFHLEAFLPLELLTLFFLWSRGYYLWGAIVATISFLTFEAAPPFVFLIGLFFLVFPGESRSDSAAGVAGASSGVRRGGGFGSLSSRFVTLRTRIHTRSGQYSLALMVGSIVAYGLLLVVSANAGTVFPAYTLRSPQDVFLSGPPQLALALPGSASAIVTVLIAWVLALALVAFLPLLAPRTWLILAPWAVVTLFAPARFGPFGNSAAFVAAFPLFLGVAYGLRGVPIRLSSTPDLPGGPPTAGVTPRSVRRYRLLRPRSLWPLAIAVAIGLNLFLSPVNPIVQGSISRPGGLGNGYWLSYHVPYGYPELEQLLAKIPPGSPVLASDVLFPFVANNAHAYALFYVPQPPLFLPFNRSHLPQYFLMADLQFFAVPPWLQAAVANRSIYGQVGSVIGTPVGSAFLYELSYRGPSVEYSLGPTSAATYRYPLLEPGLAAELLPVPGSSAAFQITSIPGELGSIWSGPDITLASGCYLAVSTVSLLGTTVPAPAKGTLVLGLQVAGLGTLFAGFEYTVPDLSTSTAVSLSLKFLVSQPTPLVEFRGIQNAPGVEIALDSVTISPCAQ